MNTPATLSFPCILRAWNAHESELRNYLRHRVGDAHPADDLLQEVFVKAMQQGKQFCTLENTRAWLFQVARNALIDHYRLRREVIELPEDIPQPETVRDYELLYTDAAGQTHPLTKVTRNHQRLNRHTFSAVEAKSLRLQITATNGAGTARVYEVRCYA